MSEKTAIVTVSTANQFHRVKPLMEQVARHIPDAVRVVCCVDSHAAVSASEVCAHATVNAIDLDVPRFRQLAFALPATGLCCALKPAAVLHAMEATSAERVLYFDNDMALYRGPAEALEALAESSMLLTPHITEPLPKDAMPNEVIIQKYGIWNAGMFGARADTEAKSFLRWWSRIMTDPRLLSGHHGWDQQWLEFAPAMVEGVKILRDPTYNVALWNLASRRLARGRDGWEVDGRDLTTFHFSWFDESNPRSWLRGQPSCNLQITEEMVGLGEEYAEALKVGGVGREDRAQYGFGRFRDGTEITAQQRELIAGRMWDCLGADDDLFDPEWTHSAIPGGGALGRWEPRRRGAGISRRVKQTFKNIVGR